MLHPPSLVRRRPLRAAVLAAGLTLAAGVPAASAAVNPSVAPAAATAGATAGPVTFTFRTTTPTTTRLMLIVPPVSSGAPWALPQTTNAAAPGYVTFTRGTCAYARNAGAVRGAAPDRVIVAFSCAANQQFQVVYRPGTIPTFAATYTFGTRLDSGTGYGPVQSNSPKIRVDAAALAALRVQPPAGTTAGVPFDTVVTAVDRFGNRRFKETFTVTGGLDGPLDEFTSAPLVQGRATLRITPKTAGARTFTAINATETAVGSAPTTVAAGPLADLQLDLAEEWVAFGLPRLLTGASGVTPVDAYGNPVTGYTGTIRWTSTDPLAVLPVLFDFANPVIAFTNAQFGTAGTQTVTVTDVANAALSGSDDISVAGPQAVDDTAEMLDPYHSRSAGGRVDVLYNDLPNIILSQPKRVTSVTTPRYVNSLGETVFVGSAAPTPDGLGVAVRLTEPASGPVAGREYCEPDSPCALPELTFSYTMSDGVNASETADVTLEVTSPEWEPPAAPEGYEIDENGEMVLVSDGETLPIEDPFTVTEVGEPDPDTGEVAVTLERTESGQVFTLDAVLVMPDPTKVGTGDTAQLTVGGCVQVAANNCSISTDFVDVSLIKPSSGIGGVAYSQGAVVTGAGTYAPK